jgi:two-component system NarL family sensor kinase
MPDAGCLAEAYLEQSPACHWIVDSSGAFFAVYGAAKSIFGVSPEEMKGRKPEQVLKSGTEWKGRFARVLAGESLKLQIKHSDMTWNVSVFPVRWGEKVYAAGLAREAGAWATAEQELRHTVLGALKATEYARATASKFLHDSVGQNLTALGLQLDLILMDLEGASPGIGARIAEIQKMLETMMEEVREYSYELNPSTVERAGLRPALDRLIARMKGRFPGTIRINVDPYLKVPPKIASAMYHIAQEAAENAFQHSSCSSIEIAVKSTNTATFLEVRDNGRGFDPADVEAGRRGLGLLSMQHYAAEAGLELTIASSRETGTVVRASS